jgi:hypothetical protein
MRASLATAILRSVSNPDREEDAMRDVSPRCGPELPYRHPGPTAAGDILTTVGT